MSSKVAPLDEAPANFAISFLMAMRAAGGIVHRHHGRPGVRVARIPWRQQRALVER
jgi:hypothetical protein